MRCPRSIWLTVAVVLVVIGGLCIIPLATRCGIATSGVASPKGAPPGAGAGAMSAPEGAPEAAAVTRPQYQRHVVPGVASADAPLKSPEAAIKTAARIGHKLDLLLLKEKHRL